MSLFINTGLIDHRKTEGESGHWELLVLWSNGEKTWEPLGLVETDDPLSCARYASDNDLLGLSGWSHLQSINHEDTQIDTERYCGTDEGEESRVEEFEESHITMVSPELAVEDLEVEVVQGAINTDMPYNFDISCDSIDEGCNDGRSEKSSDTMETQEWAVGDVEVDDPLSCATFAGENSLLGLDALSCIHHEDTELDTERYCGIDKEEESRVGKNFITMVSPEQAVEDLEVASVQGAINTDMQFNFDTSCDSNDEDCNDGRSEKSCNTMETQEQAVQNLVEIIPDTIGDDIQYHCNLRKNSVEKKFESFMTTKIVATSEVKASIGDDSSLYQFENIIEHREKKGKKGYWELRVLWSTGQRTWEPLGLIEADDPLSCAIYGDLNGLLGLSGWSHLRGINHYDTPYSNEGEENGVEESPIPMVSPDRAVKDLEVASVQGTINTDMQFNCDRSCDSTDEGCNDEISEKSCNTMVTQERAVQNLVEIIPDTIGDDIHLRKNSAEKKFESIMTTKIVATSEVKASIGDDSLYQFEKIIKHQEKKGKKGYWELEVLWSTGERTWEPLGLIEADDPLSCAIYGDLNGLLGLSGWSHLRGINHYDTPYSNEEDESRFEERLGGKRQIQQKTKTPSRKKAASTKSRKVVASASQPKPKQRFLPTKRKVLPTASEFHEHNDLRLSDCDKGGMKIGDLRVSKVSLTQIGDVFKADDSFIAHIAGSRMSIIEYHISGEVKKTIVQENDKFEHDKFELISTKMVKPEKSGRFGQRESSTIQCVYMHTAGPRLKVESPWNLLNKIGDFSSLSDRKAVARLDLIQSPASKNKLGKFAIQSFPDSLVEDIPEMGHEGCGFICEDLLSDLMRNHSNSARVCCIQVRLFIPRKGVYKGMLMKKKMGTGAKIQLPDSMRKVPASIDIDASEIGTLVICQAGVDPSKNNALMARLPSINPSADPPPASFEPDKLKDMILRLFEVLSVPKRECEKYRDRSIRKSSPKKSTRDSGEGKKIEKASPLPAICHCYLRGVADPTMMIPPNTVYITGISNAPNFPEIVFITRSPCIKADDGRRIKVLRKKPKSITKEAYEWLNKMPFGIVIFGFPKPGCKPAPVLIANGDLDGDRYFCCWDKTILEHTDAALVGNISIPRATAVNIQRQEDAEVRGLDADRFREVQDAMISVTRDLRSCDKLTKLFWTLSGKAADNDRVKFLRNEDAESFADAFNLSLDYAKHGKKIELPFHLFKDVPTELHKCLARKN